MMVKKNPSRSRTATPSSARMKGSRYLTPRALVIGPTNIASRMPVHASEMYAKNLFNFISPFIKDGALALDWEDEVVAGTCLTHAGEVRHAGVKQVLGL